MEMLVTGEGFQVAPMIRLNVSATAPPTGVKDIYYNGISVYPNPSSGEISIDIADFNAYYLSVKDILGKEVYSEKLTIVNLRLIYLI